jgi:hypothetical protein|tara:strand:- start:39 stop:272 length:234 start_codon:yes stop_codon:yes gene_type:complete
VLELQGELTVPVKKIPTAKMAHYRIDQHEKLCRIMQKQTHEMINRMMARINRLEIVVWISTISLIGGMFTIILKLIN